MPVRFPFVTSPPRFAPPPKACDCHIHVFGEAADYPYAEGRTYTPPDALPEDGLAMLHTLGIERVVLVQPSIYGTDNSRMVDAMATFGEMARGVAVVGEDVGRAELEWLHAAGVRGVRLNVDSFTRDDFEELARRMVLVAGRIREIGWHLEVHVGPHMLQALVPIVEQLAVDVVFDHMAKIPAHEVPGHPGLGALQRMLKSGRCWVKLSGAYRVSRNGGHYEEVAQLARALVEANPERIVWGSDWPHTPPHGHDPAPDGEVTPFQPLDTGKLLDLLLDWASDEGVRKGILVDNPARLYDFA
ncbi:MAG: amidohydrolase family protein [Proteobacteria bacterium]|nr:amidohydrolase family protein [Pseudomonadota bacterium]